MCAGSRECNRHVNKHTKITQSLGQQRRRNDSKSLRQSIRIGIECASKYKVQRRRRLVRTSIAETGRFNFVTMER